MRDYLLCNKGLIIHLFHHILVRKSLNDSLNEMRKNINTRKIVKQPKALKFLKLISNEYS